MKTMMAALITIMSLMASITSAQIATDLQIDNAKKAAFEVVEKIARDRESIILTARPGWRLTSLDLKSANPTNAYKATPIQLFTRKVNRIAVRAYINAVSPEGKVDWFAGGHYRILVDLKDNGEVIAAEINFFNNLMSYEEIAGVKPAHE